MTPVPSSAITIWKDGDSIHVLCDGHEHLIKLQPWEWFAEGRQCGHADSMKATCPVGGLRTIALVLKNRERFAERTIAHEASPSQWDISSGHITKLARAEERANRALLTQADRKAKAKEREQAEAAKLAETKRLVKDPEAWLRNLGLIP